MAHREEFPHQPSETASNSNQSNLESSSDQLEHSRALIEDLHFPSSPSLTQESAASTQKTTSDNNSPSKTEQDVKLDLPPGWEARETPEGQAYYVDHITKTTTWLPPPLAPANTVTNLPPGWEERRNAEGRVYFLDHSTQTSTWVPPPQVTTVASLPPGWEEERTAGGRVYYADHKTGTTSSFPPFAIDKDNSLPSIPETIQNDSASSTIENNQNSETTLAQDQSSSGSSVNETGSTFSPLAAIGAAARDIGNAYPLPNTSDNKKSRRRSPHNAPWLEDQKLDKFVYTPLGDSSRFIRLLFVEAAESYSDVLECRLEAVPLEAVPLAKLREYVALSYVWGKPVFNTAMVCNDTRLDITPSISAALRRYRTTRRCAEGTPIWADAICINQEDKREKDRQISLMSRIYSQASEVFAYLGEAPADWSPTYGLIYVLFHAHDHMIRNGLERIKEDMLFRADGLLNSVQRNAEDEIRRYFSLPSRDALAWGQLIKFSSSPWFVRTWIIQEVALARKVILFYGRYPVAWKIFSTAFEYYKLLRNHFGQPHVEQQDPWGSWNSLGVGRLRSLCEVARPSVEKWNTLIDFLTQTVTEFSTTDPRDKVIGILGLLGEGLTSQRTAMLAAPATVDEVYYNTAVHLVDLGAAHVMIRFAGLSRRKAAKQIPSWVPDWSAQTVYFGTPATIQRLDHIFCAAGHSKSQVYLEGRREAEQQHCLSEPLPTKLIVSGAVIDTIKFIGQSNSSSSRMFSSNVGSTSKSDTEQKSDLVANNPNYSHSYTTFKNWYSSARECLNQASNSIGSMPYDDLEEAFARTLIFNNLNDTKKHPGVFAPIQDVVKLHDELIATLKADQNFYFHLGNYIAVEHYFVQVLTCYETRSFVVTEKGYMAMVPKTSVKEDKVALFCGSPTLVVLRDVKMEETRIEAKLVGETYVHGLMEGQLKDRQDDLGIREIALV